jgi:hypothetical protein
MALKWWWSRLASSVKLRRSHTATTVASVVPSGKFS